MQVLSGVRQAIVGFYKLARALVRSIPIVGRHHRRQTSEAERLDRIRNPLKYLGKS